MIPSLDPRRTLSLFLGLALFPSLAATVFTTSNSPPTQCGPFTVNWGGPNQTTATPFTLLVLPLDGSPIILRLPDSSFNPVTKTGKYTLDKLPLKSATQFVLTMGDSSGRGTGGVSLIQTVGDSSDASCLTDEVLPMSSFFTPIPLNPSQCSDQTLSWNSTRYQEPPDIRGFIPGGQAFTLVPPLSNSATQEPWTVHIREGTQYVFLALPMATTQDFTGNSDARTSPLITVNGKSSKGDSCLSTRSPSSTSALPISSPATSTPTTPTVVVASIPEPTDPSVNVKVAAIVGGIVGGLGFIAIVCALIVLYRSSKRKNKTRPPSISLSSYDSSTQPRSKSSRKGVRSSFAGITTASTQVSRGTRTAGTPNMMNKFGATLGGDNGTTHTVSPGAVAMDGPPLNTQGRTEYSSPPSRPSRSAVSPPSSSPIISVADDDSGDRDGEGDQAVNEEYAFGSRRGLSMRARMDGAGNVYSSRGNRTRENEIGTEYVIHTDAGGVTRVVDLPPLYNDLWR